MTALVQLFSVRNLDEGKPVSTESILNGGARGAWLTMETAGRRDELGFQSEHLRVCVELRNSYPATV